MSRTPWTLTALFAFSILSLCPAYRCRAAPEAVDGDFADWKAEGKTWADPAGDGEDLDLLSVRVRSDRERVTFLFELSPELNLQSGNHLTLVIDGDGDPSTGTPVEGIGAELRWTFGEREGVLYEGDEERHVEQSLVGLLQAPTVSSSRFEVSLLRHADDMPVVSGPEMSFVLVDRSRAGGDRLPDAGKIMLELSDSPPVDAPEVSLERREPDDIRVLTYNVLFDGLFKRPGPFLRILEALDPDIICFQEIWSHTAAQAADQVSLAIPDAEWRGAHTTEGQIVSRYPLLEETPIDEAGNFWALVDLPDDRYASDIGIVSAHPPCCEQEVERQKQLDAVAAWLREKTAGGSEEAGEPALKVAPGTARPDPASRPAGSEHDPQAPLQDARAPLPDGTPVVVAGDMNLVGGSIQLRTLLEGLIVFENVYGPSRPPDWDGTPLADTDPRHAGGLANYTWRDARSSFSPGKLDYIVFTDSVLELGNAFVLDTERLPREVLERHGLRATDTLRASDHLPVVADFRLRESGAGPAMGDR